MSNDANQRSPLEEEGFVSNNTEVPCRGHLGFYAIFAGTVPYEELVSKGRELGIPGYGALEPYDWSHHGIDWDSWVPRPRSGSKAFSFALKDLNRDAGLVETDDWEDQNGNRVARVFYEVVMLRHSKEWKFVRRWRGKNVATGQWDSVTEDLFRIRYIPPQRGSELYKWTRRYVHQTLHGRTLENSTRAELSELAGLYEVTPWDASVKVSPEQIREVTNTLRQGLIREATTVDQEALRAIMRRAVKDVGGMRFGGSSGGVYYIPDWNRDQRYMEYLVPFSELINWFGTMNLIEDSYEEGEDGELVRVTASSATTFRLLGYVDDARQMEYLRQDVAREVVSSVNAYYEDLLTVVRDSNDEDLPKEIDRLFREQRELKRKLGDMRQVVGSGITEATAPQSGVQNAFNARLLAVTSKSQQQANRLRQLMNIELDDETGDE